MTASVQRVQKPTDNPTGPSAGGIRRLIGVGAVGAAVALAVGVYGRSHVPTGVTIAPLRPSQMLGFKSALATMGAALAIGQLASAAWLYGRIGRGRVPRWVGPAHRWLGTAAFVVTLPVAYHCLWSLGFQTTTPRVLIHSLLGCAFYGAFATKLLMLRASRVPAWAVPLVGGALVALLVGLWFSSALWFFTLVG